jgi:hypothetical protein
LAVKGKQVVPGHAGKCGIIAMNCRLKIKSLIGDVLAHEIALANHLQYH